MTVVTVYGDIDGNVLGTSTTYSTARSTATTATANVLTVGQQLSGSDYNCWESFISFDVSALPHTYLVYDAQLYLHCSANDADTAFNVEVSFKEWGASLTTGDWVAGASLSTSRSWVESSASFVADDYTVLTQQAALWAATTLTTDYHLRYMLYSSRHRGNNAPTADEYLTFTSASAAGTTEDPFIVLTYASYSPVGGYLDGAMGPVAVWNRELTPTEVAEVMAATNVVYDRSLDRGTVQIAGHVTTRSGALVPATHVRAGWWLENLEANNSRSTAPRPLLITGHSVDLDAGKNALTVGADWMEAEVGVRMGELLASPPRTAAPFVHENVAKPAAEEEGGGETDGLPYGPWTNADPAQMGLSSDSGSTSNWYLNSHTHNEQGEITSYYSPGPDGGTDGATYNAYDPETGQWKSRPLTPEEIAFQNGAYGQYNNG